MHVVAEAHVTHPYIPQLYSQEVLKALRKVPGPHAVQVVAEAHCRQLVILQAAVQRLLLRVKPGAHCWQVLLLLQAMQLGMTDWQVGTQALPLEAETVLLAQVSQTVALLQLTQLTVEQMSFVQLLLLNLYPVVH